VTDFSLYEKKLGRPLTAYERAFLELDKTAKEQVIWIGDKFVKLEEYDKNYKRNKTDKAA
jgi:hypothetical protein